MTASATDKKNAAAEKKTVVDNPDMTVIAPEERLITVGGVECRVRRVRTRELMLFVRVVTSGGAYGLQKVDFKDKGQIGALILMAIPEAHEEFLELLRALVVPTDSGFGPTHEGYVQFTEAMENPPVDTTFEVAEVLVEQESGTFVALWGKVQNLLGMTKVLGKS
jgi:hypothetical protein